jgi:uncharacterized protein (TIGR03086 family)
MAGSVEEASPMTNDTSTAPAPPAVAKGSDPRDLLARAMATAATTIRGVTPDQMELPTPCHDFDVRGLIAHLVAVLDRIEVIGSRGNVFSVPAQSEMLPDDAWSTRWATTAHTALDAWADDALLDADRQLPWTVLPGRAALAIYVNELTTHTWDLAHATGQQPEWDPEVLQLSLAAIHAELPDAVRAPQWAEVAAQMPPGVPFVAPFADAVDVPAEAAMIDRLVAWNGRRP